MSIPRRGWQVGLLATLLTGCAAQQPQRPATGAADADPRPPAPIAASAEPAPPRPAASGSPAAVPVVAAKRPAASPVTAAPRPTPDPARQPLPAAPPATSTDGGFLQADGRLAPALQHWMQTEATARGWPVQETTALLAQARYSTTAVRLMTPSGNRVRRSWTTYRQRFVEPVRIRHGVEFWQANRAALERSAAAYGVPASVIVAIIGVETLYGRHTGNFRLLDALASLGFYYPDPRRPERGELFRGQLADLIDLHLTGTLDARQATGSYAGAMGLPQFLPGSLRRYAADGNGDGIIDLFQTEDAIASVASFLRLHGWVPGLPIFAPAEPPSDAQPLVKGGLEPTLDWQTLQAAGARPRPGHEGAQPWQDRPMGMVDLVDESRRQVEYRIGTPNFFALTHYNRSYFYAASVAELAAELARRVGAPAP